LLSGIAREEARPAVPPYVYETRAEFRICPLCSRIYWPGTHRERMAAEIGEILEKGGDEHKRRF
jgi:uncharacterized protein with PIN domain